VSAFEPAPQGAGPGTPPRGAAALRALPGALLDRPLIMLGIVFVILLFVAEIVSPGYISGDQIGTILRFAAPLAILAAGQTLVMLTGGIDLSVANTATASAYIMAGQGSQGTVRALLIGLGVGLAIGLVNGIGVGVFNVNPLIMTLGMASIVIGLLTVEAQSFVTGVPLVPSEVRDLAATNLVGDIPANLLLWAPLAILILLGLRYSGYGRMLYALGDNREAVWLAGVRSWQVLVVVYALCGMLAAIAGIMLVGLTNAADLGLANDYLLPSVAAVVIGGTSIFGGVGGYAGTIMGALILTLMDSILTLLKAQTSVKQILYGAIILALAALYAQSTKRT
jgi:ribose transport system permease protein